MLRDVSIKLCCVNKPHSDAQSRKALERHGLSCTCLEQHDSLSIELAAMIIITTTVMSSNSCYCCYKY